MQQKPTDANVVQQLPAYETLSAFAARHAVALNTVRRWVSRGMPVVRLARIVRVKSDAADAWIEAGGSAGSLLTKECTE